MIFTRSLLIVLLGVGFIETYSQMHITFPVSRVVFQRDNQNIATFNVAGDYSVELDKVEARLTPMQVGQGESTDWQTISTVSKGIFSGTITGKGGWYKLNLRGFKSGSVVIETSLERVGIGEVFLVAGQSNAEGQLVYPGAEIGTTEDRVSCIDFVEYLFDENLLPFKFSQLGNFTKLGPYNPVPWYWARLGEKLCKKLNVPVLFFGNALGGSSVEWWAQSANGADLRQQQPLFIKVAGMPYRGMRGSLQHYASRTGIRAVLWHQGESDINMPSQDYFNFLKIIIEKSRKDVEHNNLPWVVARVGNVNGQNQVINQVPNVYQGPNTDESIPDIPQFRYIGHFANEGLNLAASLWFDVLGDYFFLNTIPKKPSLLLPFSIGCFDDNLNQVELRPIVGLNNYRWTDNIYSQNRTVQSGTYICRAQNTNGFAFFTQPIVVNNSELQEPSIRISSTSKICSGDSISVFANKSFNTYSWSTGETSPQIIVTQSNNYSLSVKNLYGCQSAQVSTAINFFPSPKVRIVAERSDSFCEGGSLLLYANTATGISYNWSTGENTKEIIIKKPGIYTLSVKNENGCESLKDSIKTIYIPSPLASISTPADNNTFCKGDSLILKANNSSEYFWSNGSSEQQIIVKEAGNYSLKIKDNKNCFSIPVSVEIFEKESPQKPTVNISGAFQIDAFSATEIVGISEQLFNWKKDNQLLKDNTSTLKAVTSGDYEAREVIKYQLKNERELICYSPYSDKLNLFIPYKHKGLSVYPNPNKSGIFNIETIADVSNASITVFTIGGKIIFRGTINDLKQKRILDLSHLESGSYLMRLSSNEFNASTTLYIHKQ